MIAAPIQNGISQMPLYKKSPGSSNHQQMQAKRKESQRKRVEVTSLQDLISQLYTEFDKKTVDVDYVNEIMTAYKSTPHEWKKYAKFDRYRYTRNLVDSGNGKFNLIILCWGEGHGSAIHDHADAHCFMKILDGTLSEVRFAFPDEGDRGIAEDPKLKEIGRTNLEINEVCYINGTIHYVDSPCLLPVSEPCLSLGVKPPKIFLRTVISCLSSQVPRFNYICKCVGLHSNAYEQLQKSSKKLFSPITSTSYRVLKF